MSVERPPGLRRWLTWPMPLTTLWVLVPLIVVLRVGLVPASPQDYWWPIVQGRAMDQLGYIPTSNLFLFSIPHDAPFMNQPWLAQWLMWRMSDALGHSSLVWLNAILISLATLMAMSFAMRRPHSPKLLGVLGAAGVILASSGISVRTQMFAYPLLVIGVGVPLLIAEERLSWRWMCAVILGTVAWTNVHGTFLLAPLLVGAVATGDLIERAIEARQLDRNRLLKWTGCVLLVALATLINPYGYEVWTYIFTYTNELAAKAFVGNVTEWQAHGLTPDGLVFYAAAILSIGLAIWKWRVVGLRALIPFLGLSVIALDSARGLLWWGLGLIVLLAPLTTLTEALSHEEEELSTPQSALHLGLVLLFVGGVFSTLPGMPVFDLVLEHEDPAGREGHAPKGSELEAFDRHHPVELIGLIERGHVTGRLFHEQAVGGLVEFMLARDQPRLVAFVDQRFEMTPAHLWQDYFHVMQAREGWREVLRRHEIDLVLIDRLESPKLVKALDLLVARDEWEEVGSEMTYVLYVRK